MSDGAMEAVCGADNHSNPRNSLCSLCLFIRRGLCRDVPSWDAVPVTIRRHRIQTTREVGPTVAIVCRFVQRISLVDVSTLR
jgi:hypothetical protein